MCAEEPLALSLVEVNSRKAPDYSSVYAGRTVKVRGVVNAERYHFPQFTVLAIQNEPEGGAVLSVPANDGRLDIYQPGDELEVVGVVAFTAGVVTIQPQSINLVGRKPAPQAVTVTPGEVQNFKYLGRPGPRQRPSDPAGRQHGGRPDFHQRQLQTLRAETAISAPALVRRLQHRR